MSLLTVAELRGYINDAVDSDATLQQRIDDTEAELNRRYGASDAVTETVYAYGATMLPLKQVPASVSTVTDTHGSTEIVLVQDATDGYRIRGSYLTREVGSWGRFTTVTYVPRDSSAERRRVLVKLIQLDMNYSPGMGSQGAGPWSESYKEYLAEREKIMATLGMDELFA